MTSEVAAPDAYRVALAEYLRSHSEAALYAASNLSQSFVERGIGPEEIVAMHFEAIELVTERASYREKARATTDGLQFLLEVMIAYGVQYQAYLGLRLAELDRRAELQATAERRRAELAAQAEQEKLEILASIAHELGTPLTAAKGFVDYAERLITSGRYEAVPTALGTAREALDRLSHLTADLVRAERGEAMQMEAEPLELGAVLQRACDWARAAAAEKDIAVTYTAAPTPVWVRGNADALLTVVGNLLSNAVRYTPAGGAVELCASDAGATAEVTVRDTGIGMAPEVQARIFEKFYRAAEARQMSASGLGLGLALTLGIIKAHGGQIAVESAPGAGSAFRVTLPRAPREEERDA